MRDEPLELVARSRLAITRHLQLTLPDIRQQNRDEGLASTTGMASNARGICLQVSSHTRPTVGLTTLFLYVCRLDRLRQVVPHAERANTAAFLEEVINYIQKLQRRIQELESGLPASDKTLQLPVASVDAGAAAARSQSPQVTATESDALLTGNFSALPESSAAGQQASVQREKRARDEMLGPAADGSKIGQDLTESSLPTNPDKDGLNMAEKRLKLGESGSIAALLS